MTPTQSLFLLAAVMLAPHIRIKTANKLAAIAIVAGFVFWIVELLMIR